MEGGREGKDGRWNRKKEELTKGGKKEEGKDGNRNGQIDGWIDK